MTLTQAALGADTLLKKTLLVVAGTILIAIAAQVNVQLQPVPITLQSLAIAFIALSFGPRLAVVTVLAYLAEGFAGLPVFAKLGAGPAYFVGPTGGFLLGFVAMAWIAGQGAGRGLFAMVLFALLGTAALYVPGLAWPMALADAFGISGKWISSDWSVIWTYWVGPFVAWDIAKAVLAAMIVAGALKVLRKT